MSAAQPLVEYDNTSIQIFSGLADNVLGNISDSAGKMLDVACLFFDKDVSSALKDFQKLYQQNNELDREKNDTSLEVDELLAAAANPEISSAALAQIGQSITQTGNSLATLQKNLEAMIQQDEHIKSRLIPVMQCMQYEDLISNRVERLIKCWSHMVSLLNAREAVDIAKELRVFDAFLSTEDEHIRFYHHVLKADYLAVDGPDHCITSLDCDIDCVNTLSERLFCFSQSSLNDCIEQTQHAFDELMSLLSLITGESKDISYLFSDNNDSLDDIKLILNKSIDASEHEATHILEEIAEAKKNHSTEANQLIQSFMTALQSQDLIRQNIENIGKFHQHWSNYRDDIKQQGSFNDEQHETFGNAVISQVTSHAEREVVKMVIPAANAGLNSQAEEDDCLF